MTNNINKDNLLIKKPVTFYVDKRIFAAFKKHCATVVEDNMKTVIMTLARLYAQNPTSELTQYLKKVIDTKLNYTISYDRNNLHRFRARLSETEVFLLKELGETLNTSISKLVNGIMFMVVAFKLDRQTYLKNKIIVEQSLPNIDNAFKLELIIHSKLYHRLIEFINTNYHEDIHADNPSINEKRQRIKNIMKEITTKALTEYITQHTKESNTLNNVFNFLSLQDDQNSPND